MTAGWASGEDLSPSHGKLKAPWARITNHYECGGRSSWCVNSQMRMECSAQGVQPGPSSVGGLALRDAAAPEGDTSVQAPNRNGGDQGEGDLNAVNVEEMAFGQGDEDPGERWFRQENTRVDIRILACMEDDLNPALLFEHGGSQWASQLWITRILLGRLSWERKTLGKAMEFFAKLQRRDIMHNMVKLHGRILHIRAVAR